MVVTGKFRGTSDPSCSYFTVANIHINSECAKRRSVCSALLLFIRDLCLKLGAVVLTGDFSKAVERETLSGDSGDGRISPLEAAFRYACVLWPNSGVTLWSLGGELHGTSSLFCHLAVTHQSAECERCFGGNTATLLSFRVTVPQFIVFGGAEDEVAERGECHNDETGVENAKEDRTG